VTAIETTIRGKTADTRQGVRRAQSLPLVKAMKVWLETELKRIPPRSGLADAIRYALTRWSAVCTENLNPKILVMKPAKDGVRFDASGSLNGARDRRLLIQ
jgi:hypothetical protein